MLFAWFYRERCWIKVCTLVKGGLRQKKLSVCLSDKLYRQFFFSSPSQMNAWYLFIQSYSPDRAALGSRPGRDRHVVVLGKTLFIFTVPLPTLV